MSDVLVIAEAGVNHNGSLDLALQLVDAAAKCGADIVKFQTFKSGAVISAAAPKAEYQKNTTGVLESQLDMVRKLELSESDHELIVDRCLERGVTFMSTPFDRESADFLVRQLKVSQLKVASGEMTNAPFLVHLGSFDLPVIMSTGMCVLGEIECALGALAFGLLGLRETPSERIFLDLYASGRGRSVLKEKVSLLHCTTEYPAAYDQVNLRVMDTMRAAFALPIGLSDHTPGIAVPIAAVARGATIIEKHFTLDRDLPGPDHKASLQPDELAAMIVGIRQVESAIGDGVKRPTTAEEANRSVARRSLVAMRSVKAGEAWTVKNLTCKRPGNGLSPLRYWEHIGRPAGRDYAADELLVEDKA